MRRPLRRCGNGIIDPLEGLDNFRQAVAQFDAAPGTSRPAFASALHPIGAVFGPEATEEGRLVAAMGRLATAKLTFEVDQHGVPGHFQVPNASEAVWGSEATALVGQWRFTPGMKNEIVMPVIYTVELAWGARGLDFSKLSQVYEAINERTVAATAAVPGATDESNKNGTARIVVDEQAQAAKLVTRIAPEYPASANGLRGTVRPRVLIGIDGRIREVEVVDGDPGLSNAAANAVKRWAYQETLLNGTPVEVTTEADVDVGPR